MGDALTCRTAIQLPSPGSTRSHFRSSLGRAALRTRAESGGKVNVLMEDGTELYPEGKNRKNPKAPEALLAGYRLLGAPEGPAPYSLIGYCAERAAGLLCELRMKWSDRARGRANDSRGPLIGHKRVVPGGLCIWGQRPRFVLGLALP